MIPNHSIDFAFSFDSLVHVEVDVIDSYIKELANKLTTNGIAFLHHSNLTESQADETAARHMRASSVGAEIFRNLCARHNVSCISQEIIDWGGFPALDCLSMITPIDSRLAQSTVILRNDDFGSIARVVASCTALYC
jgi:hypothetical protein